MSLKEMTEQDLRSCATRCLTALAMQGGDLLEGTLELMDTDVSQRIIDELWSVSAKASRSVSQINIPGDTSDLEDHELQEYSAAVFEKCAHMEGGFGQLFDTFGKSFAEEVAMRIEEWRDRYEVEESSGMSFPE
jgi:hypothetical protein